MEDTDKLIVELFTDISSFNHSLDGITKLIKDFYYGIKKGRISLKTMSGIQNHFQINESAESDGILRDFTARLTYKIIDYFNRLDQLNKSYAANIAHIPAALVNNVNAALDNSANKVDKFIDFINYSKMTNANLFDLSYKGEVPCGDCDIPVFENDPNLKPFNMSSLFYGLDWKLSIPSNIDGREEASLEPLSADGLPVNFRSKTSLGDKLTGHVKKFIVKAGRKILKGSSNDWLDNLDKSAEIDLGGPSYLPGKIKIGEEPVVKVLCRDLKKKYDERKDYPLCTKCLERTPDYHDSNYTIRLATAFSFQFAEHLIEPGSYEGSSQEIRFAVSNCQGDPLAPPESIMSCNISNGLVAYGRGAEPKSVFGTKALARLKPKPVLMGLI